jgi:hypothetical protein
MDNQNQPATTAESTASEPGKVMKRVILIRLPPGEQNSSTSQQLATSQIPPNLIGSIINSEPNNNTTIVPTETTTHDQQNNNNNNNATNSSNDGKETEDGDKKLSPNKKTKTKDEDSNMYKNYSPKQREWMLVYLGYARGLLGMPFEEKLQESVVQRTNSILAKRGRFCNINRVPSSKTLRTVWKNLWKEERTVASIIRRGGRPRIDPTLKREKRNERERRKRALAREKKEMEKSMAS